MKTEESRGAGSPLSVTVFHYAIILVIAICLIDTRVLSFIRGHDMPALYKMESLAQR